MVVGAFQFLGGLVLLLVGGRLLVAASIDAARRLGVAPLVVGLTLVAWGTSAPELALNLVSAFEDRSALAIGNIVGANICTMALVLGACALVRPLRVEERLIRVEIRLNAAILGFMAVIGWTAGFSRLDAAVMLSIFVAYSAWTIVAALRSSRTVHAARAAAGSVEGDRSGATADASSGASCRAGDLHPEAASSLPMSWLRIAIGFALGLALLGLGGTLASDGASAIALGLGVPAAVVGVTIVSIGTTLPELVTGLTAVRRGQTDLAMGNVVGSCIFNAGAIFGAVGLIAPPGAVPSLLLPIALMGVLAIALVPISRTFGRTVSRVEGFLLLGTYVAFLVVAALAAR